MRSNETVVWISAPTRYLAYYLLTHAPCSREQVFAAFWRGKERAAAKSAFHCTKYRVHQSLGRQLVVYEDGLYRIDWGPDCWFDVVAFESLLDERARDRQDNLERAIALYRGDFMGNYDAEWCLLIRERLRMRYRDALLELGECYVAKNELDRALAALNKAVALDDYHEPAIQALMRLYKLNDQPRLAQDLFHQFAQRLQGIQALPERETQLLYRSAVLEPA